MPQNAIKNLGTLTGGKILVFGGAYGNLEALEALLIEAAAQNIPPRNIICTGDTIAYCANPREVVDMLRDSGVHVIKGNCEESLAEDKDACGCGFDEGSACDVLSKSWFAYCREAMTDEIKTWFASLPAMLRFEFAKKRFTVLHGSPDNISEFVFASNDDAKLTRAITATDSDCVIGGHCGLPFTRIMQSQNRNQCWHNPGVIGMPANDGTNRVWYGVIESVGGDIVFHHRALNYNAAAAQAKMREAGLPDGYANALTSGLWPSLDILPPKEADATGVALAEGRVVWHKAD